MVNFLFYERIVTAVEWEHDEARTLQRNEVREDVLRFVCEYLHVNDECR